MKKIFSTILAILAVTFSVFAQDARQRTVNTIVVDVLAQLPAANDDEFQSNITDLVKSAPQSVEIIAGMFQAPEKGMNNKLEYAISGVVNYATAPGNEQYRAAVTEGLEKAIGKATDETAKAFFQSQLRLFGKPEPCGAGCCGLSDKELLAKAKELGASGESQKRCQSLWILNKLYGAKNASNVLAAMKDGDRAYRMTALETSAGYADDAFYAKLAKTYGSVGSDAKDDILYWLGEKKVSGQASFVLKQVGGNNSAEAISAAGKIGGEAAVKALIARLGTEDTEAALRALATIEDGISEDVLSAFENADKAKLLPLLRLSASRHIIGAAPIVLKMTESGDRDIAVEAMNALCGVANSDWTAEVAKLLDNAKAEDVTLLQKALSASVQDCDEDDQFELLTGVLVNAGNKARFYIPVAEVSSDAAVAFISGASLAGSQEAVEALCLVDNTKAAPILLCFAEKNKECLSRYVDMISDSDMNEYSKTAAFIKALALSGDEDVTRGIIRRLAGTANIEAMEAVVPFMDDKALAIDAADAVKVIGCKVPTEIPYDRLEEYFSKAMSILSVTGSADDGYSVDAMKNTLAANKPYPVSELTEEEKAAGFEMLYDGTNLDKWIGDKKNYLSMNGAINVFANYGGEGNLYTAKEYRNFIYRFEFCFLRPAVNNGVGIRTPMGVDAAYFGMCECQILDHDDPVYADLHDYQVHGSVYGVIPAKRLKHRPIGEWSYEEIKVVGDHITVTVNGEVINDGDIREACQGHNVAPDGGDVNPYTADHRNHPGMFNERGHISFCGHGRGLQFRNIRILELPD